MKITTFWILAIRILGVSALLTNMSALIYLSVDLLTLGRHGFKMSDLFLPLFGIAVLFAIVYFFILHPWKIIRLLKLDTQFEEEVININRSDLSLLQVCIIVVGGVALLKYIPQLVREAVTMFQNKELFFDQDPALPEFIYALIMCILAGTLATRSLLIAKWIDRKAIIQKETLD